MAAGGIGKGCEIYISVSEGEPLTPPGCGYNETCYTKCDCGKLGICH